MPLLRMSDRQWCIHVAVLECSSELGICWVMAECCSCGHHHTSRSHLPILLHQNASTDDGKSCHWQEGELSFRGRHTEMFFSVTSFRYYTAAAFRHSWRLAICRPSESKFLSSSHASNPFLACGQSTSSMANHAVSRLWPFTTMCCRKIPSNVKPSRTAAFLEGPFSSLHFHSYRR